jgi:hypothetical protein
MTTQRKNHDPAKFALNYELRSPGGGDGGHKWLSIYWGGVRNIIEIVCMPNTPIPYLDSQLCPSSPPKRIEIAYVER